MFKLVKETEKPSSSLSEYRIGRKRLCDLPADKHHKDNKSEVILVFPVKVINRNGEDYADIISQQVSAYLLIRGFGFPVSAIEEY